jgi:DNA-directed RNA polymerase specialized sigma24 family protein
MRMPMDESLFAQLEAVIQTGNSAAQIIVLSLGRLRTLARRMLHRHAALRRLIDTDDLLQNAAIRMHRALRASSSNHRDTPWGWP